MFHPLLLGLIAFVGVATLVGGAAMLFRPEPTSKVEDRLHLLTTRTGTADKDAAAKEASILSEPLDDDSPGMTQTFFERFGNFHLLFEQADTSLTTGQMLAVSATMAVIGAVLGALAGVHFVLVPVLAMFFGCLPFVWLMFRRNRRFRAFAAQLPDALEMLARSLRSGQSLGFGFNMVATEMPAPISKEFGRIFEEQNLGVPLDDSLRSLTDRIPNLDLKFFVTAVILQRQTGGDLAEILDKIGDLIRERFRIWGQVQALTGEGRLSGVVLLALPFVLFLAVYQLNPDYIQVLFTDPLGTKMLAVAVFMQILGALVIRKIVNIKV
ncbi:MAG: type II secretion system F family protein [Thermoguttaceae bacterium]